MEQRLINIIGHKNPDTDSICSAIAYAYLKNIEHPGHYIARRAGGINNETNFVLNYFGASEPDYLEDVNVQMRDIDFRETKGVPDTISIRNAWQLMKEQDVVTLPIIQNGNKLEGLITINDIAKSYMDVFDNNILALARTPISNLMEVLEGTLICGNPHARIVNGKVLIGAANIDVMDACIEEDDLVLVADREETQRAAIEQGAFCIIVCLNAKISPEIIQLAEEHQCNIITTYYDTYSAARMINQCIPIRYFMRRSNLVTFQLDDTLDSVKEIMSKLRHRDFPITDAVGNYYGMVSRRNLLAMRRKQVILVDHNERSQAVTGIENAEILEIIDHHRIGSMETINPVYFRNQPVGCTATIVYQMYLEQGVTPPKQMAGLLCSAILSDTLMFRSPTCTPMDESAARQLSNLAGIDIESYAMEMFAAGSDLVGKSPEEIFYQDFKTFQVGDITFGAGQISSLNQQELADLQVKIHAYLKDSYTATKCDMIFFVMTNILDEGSTMLFYGEQADVLVKEAFQTELTDNTCYLPGVVSRKKQIVPLLVSTLQQWDN
ncbi:MAG: putative manganese-dependent inorganic diphosphatase [Lachnospiraceae bacterium]|nr:putative manganese-dependent inorganic diphosphatase [Lachnospiraceae bacterium]